MSFITESELSRYRDRTKTYTKDNIINLKESLSRDRSMPLIFLSHKHDEIAILQDVIAFLKKECVDIYVDWMDEEMPAYTNSETALRLKNKIKSSNKFILIATQDAINSKWCNWELGLGDAAKYIEHIALFPINKTNQNFSGAEYLRIYPYIEYRDGTTKYKDGTFISKGFYVFTPSDKGNTISPIKEWLKKNI
ncbi:MAG: toll/interleukin-1 receptor domain-containing protein [Saprospiraceae bacterium]|nr:toll/interleukin-1 receptor domain-containing protein [Candidatus Defluviibacterium haderslevense]